MSWTLSLRHMHERCIPADPNQKLYGDLQLFPKRPLMGTSMPTQYPAVCMAMTLPVSEEGGFTEEVAPRPVRAAARVSPRATQNQKLPQLLSVLGKLRQEGL